MLGLGLGLGLGLVESRLRRLDTLGLRLGLRDRPPGPALERLGLEKLASKTRRPSTSLYVGVSPLASRSCTVSGSGSGTTPKRLWNPAITDSTSARMSPCCFRTSSTAAEVTTPCVARHFA